MATPNRLPSSSTDLQLENQPLQASSSSSSVISQTTAKYFSSEELSLIYDTFQLCLSTTNSDSLLVSDLIESLVDLQGEQCYSEDETVDTNIVSILLKSFYKLPADSYITFQQLVSHLDQRLDIQTDLLTHDDLLNIFSILSQNNNVITLQSLQKATGEFCDNIAIQQVSEMLRTAGYIDKYQHDLGEHIDPDEFIITFDKFVSLIKPWESDNSTNNNISN